MYNDGREVELFNLEGIILVLIRGEIGFMLISLYIMWFGFIK